MNQGMERVEFGNKYVSEKQVLEIVPKMGIRKKKTRKREHKKRLK